MNSINDRSQSTKKKYSRHISTTEYYKRNARPYYDQTVNLDISNRYSPFLKLLPKNGKILDAGCGSGRDSLFFKQQGYGVVSFDISKELVELASRLIGQKVLHMSFGDLDFENEFHGILANASLLHIPQEEMDDILEKIIKSPKDKWGSLCIIQVRRQGKNGRWPIF